jgi:hypothetical protein
MGRSKENFGRLIAPRDNKQNFFPCLRDRLVGYFGSSSLLVWQFSRFRVLESA